MKESVASIGMCACVFGLVALVIVQAIIHYNSEDAVAPVPCVEKTPTVLEEPAMPLGEAVTTLRATESRLLDKYEACLVLVRECVDSCCKESE